MDSSDAFLSLYKTAAIHFLRPFRDPNYLGDCTAMGGMKMGICRKSNSCPITLLRVAQVGG